MKISDEYAFIRDMLEDPINIIEKEEERSMLVEGIANWASVLKPNTKYEPVFEVELTVSKKDAQDLKSKGLKIKEENGEFKFRPKRKLHKNDGSINSPPKCVDGDNMPFTKLIGNGSKVKVQYHVFEWNNKFGKGVGADFAGIQVLELVPYAGGDGDEFEVVGETVVKEQPVFTADDDDLPFEK